jgi:6-phosphogluconolactonase
MNKVYITESPNEIARAAAEAFVQQTQQAADEDRDFYVALSGGSTPKLLYDLLVSDEFRDLVPWSRVRFFFGDERWVPHTDPQSNYKLANDNLFKPLSIHHQHVYPMPTSGDPDSAASHYETTVRSAFGVKADEVPQFDLVFLGMGDEGHTASLFPHTAVLHDNEHLVAATYVPKLDANRITFTPIMLNSASHVLLMIGGAGKAEALKQVLEGEDDPGEYPAQLLRNSQGEVMWLVDKSAASDLEGDYPEE